MSNILLPPASTREVYQCLSCAYWESQRNSKKREWRMKSADDYLIFAWFNHKKSMHEEWVFQNPMIPTWLKFPPNTTQENALWTLKEKKPFIKSLLQPRRWFEKKIISDFKFFEFFSKSACIESIYKDEFICYLFSGERVNEENKRNKLELDLRVILSPTLFIRCFTTE